MAPTATVERNGSSAGSTGRLITKSLKLPPPEFTAFSVKLVGTSPLILDAFSDARKAKLAQSQDGSAKQKPGPRDPEAEFLEAQYLIDGTIPAVPKLAFRKAIQAAAIRMTEVKGTEVLAAFQIATSDELLPLILDHPPKMRIDHVVRVGHGNLAYRAEYWPWAVVLPVRLDHEVVSFEQFIHIVYKAGLGVGIGNWRAEKKGDFGLWTIETVTDVTVYEGIPA